MIQKKTQAGTVAQSAEIARLVITRIDCDARIVIPALRKASVVPQGLNDNATQSRQIALPFATEVVSTNILKVRRLDE